jgi:prepilin-type N-terminal cleavage/methylation domain-containing protein
MFTKRGFTLIELLVVIAIITILASIVAPKVAGYIERGKMAKAVSEIRNADLALTKMLADVERKNFAHFFTQTFSFETYAEAVDAYTNIFYELLRRGRDADLTDMGLSLNPDIKKKLGTAYMDIGKDPWGTLYQFYAGPFTRQTAMYPFRSHRLDETTGEEGMYVYNYDTRIAENKKMRGQPPFDNAAGFPCPGDWPVYIYSWGGDAEVNQNLGLQAGGTQEENVTRDGHDDINNWDNQSGWSGFY